MNTFGLFYSAFFRIKWNDTFSTVAQHHTHAYILSILVHSIQSLSCDMLYYYIYFETIALTLFTQNLHSNFQWWLRHSTSSHQFIVVYIPGRFTMFQVIMLQKQHFWLVSISLTTTARLLSNILMKMLASFGWHSTFNDSLGIVNGQKTVCGCNILIETMGLMICCWL